MRIIFIVKIINKQLRNYMNKRFICLANSRKTSGRCIAGKEMIGNAIGKWIRPVSKRENHEISELDRRYQDGSTAQTFDIINASFEGKSNHSAQEENYTINDKYYWIKEARYNGSLDSLTDSPAILWETGYSSYNGKHDRIPITSVEKPIQTLYFIRPAKLIIIVRIEGAEFGNGKKKIRANFSYNKTVYEISVTDPEVERIYLALGEGRYQPTGQCYITVSLGEAWEGYYYKLAAGIFEVQ